MVQALPLFGSPLVTALARSSVRTSSGLCVPGILARCFDEIQSNGLQLEGIFRKSGSAAVINQLQAHFENVDDPFEPTLPENANVHSVAGLLKRYLQQLPEPVIPKQYQKHFLSAFDKENPKETLIAACKQLPHEHLHLLQYIIEMAVTIQQHQDKNHMSLNSLAIIFAPTCVRLDGVSQLMPNCSINPAKTGASSYSLPLTINKNHDFFQKARKLIANVIKRKVGRNPKNTWVCSKSSMSLILYQPSDLLQLDLMKESSTWVKLFEFMMTCPDVFTTLTRFPGQIDKKEFSELNHIKFNNYVPIKDVDSNQYENTIISGYKKSEINLFRGSESDNVSLHDHSNTTSHAMPS